MTIDAFLGEFSESTRKKAEKLLANPEAVSSYVEYAELWTVKGSKEYRVHSDLDGDEVTWASCTCPNGQNQSFGRARCYHVAAVMMRAQSRL